MFVENQGRSALLGSTALQTTALRRSCCQCWRATSSRLPQWPTVCGAENACSCPKGRLVALHSTKDQFTKTLTGSGQTQVGKKVENDSVWRCRMCDGEEPPDPESISPNLFQGGDNFGMGEANYPFPQCHYGGADNANCYVFGDYPPYPMGVACSFGLDNDLGE
jgi:hypothetical protein